MEGGEEEVEEGWKEKERAREGWKRWQERDPGQRGPWPQLFKSQCFRQVLGTLKGLYLHQLAHVARAVIPSHPDAEFVCGASCHLIKKLQALLLPLGVKDPRLQKGYFVCHPRAGIEVHEVTGTCGERSQHPISAFRDFCDPEPSTQRELGNYSQTYCLFWLFHNCLRFERKSEELGVIRHPKLECLWGKEIETSSLKGHSY